MKKLLGTNTLFDEASQTSRVKGFWKVTLIFLAVFYVGTAISGVITTGPTVFYVLTSDAVWNLMMGGYDSVEEMMGIIGMVTNSMPPWLLLVSLFATVGTYIPVLIYCTKIERRSLRTIGFTKNGAVREYLAGLGIGLVMFAAVYGIMLLSGQAKFAGFSPKISIGMLILFFLGFMIQGMSEEVLCRGFYYVSAGVTNPVAALIASSAVFSVLHILNPGVTLLALVNIFLFGLFAALYFLRRGNIWGIGAIHSIWNFAQGNLFGCSVSGTGNGGSMLLTEFSHGKTLFTGGSFGPEGGIAVTIILVIGIAILLPMKNKNYNIQSMGQK